jgi:acyl carrier protein
LFNFSFFIAIDFLKRVLLENSNQTQVCLAALNWQVYLQSHSSPRLQVFRNKMQIMDEKEKNMTLEDLALQPLEFRMDYVQDYIKRLLSSWSGSDIAEIDINVGLVRYGIDSIAATDMKLRIQSNIGAVFEVGIVKNIIVSNHVSSIIESKGVNPFQKVGGGP